MNMALEVQIKSMLIQVLRNQLTDLSAVATYSITNRDQKRHAEYHLRIEQTKGMLQNLDPEHPYI